eukprot:s3120_g10.t2
MDAASYGYGSNFPNMDGSSLRRRHGRELQRLASAFSALELDSQERQMAAERSCAAHVKHLEELIRSSQRHLALVCPLGRSVASTRLASCCRSSRASGGSERGEATREDGRGTDERLGGQRAAAEHLLRCVRAALSDAMEGWPNLGPLKRVTKKRGSVLAPSCELGAHEVGYGKERGHGFTFSPRRVADAGGSMRLASPVAQASLAQLAGAAVGSRVTLPRRALSPQNSPRGSLKVGSLETLEFVPSQMDSVLFCYLSHAATGDGGTEAAAVGAVQSLAEVPNLAAKLEETAGSRPPGGGRALPPGALLLAVGAYTNAVERCLHVTQGMTFDHVVETLRKDAAVWVAAHCQRGSDVLVELGQPLLVSREDTESPAGRERVRSLTREIALGTAGRHLPASDCTGHCRTSTASPRSQWALPDLICQLQIAVGTAGPQPHPSGHCRTSTASSRSQWALADLNRELQIAVGIAGPEPRAPDRSGQCRTSTASSRSQWALSDLNREPQIPVGTAGRQPRAPDRSGYLDSSEKGVQEALLLRIFWVGHQGAPAFQPPCGSFWDLPQSFKALPRPPASAPALKAPKLPELRNFAAGVQRHVGGRTVYISPPRRAPSPPWVSPSMATLATSALSGCGRPMPCIPVGVASNTSPVRFVASPRTYESPRVAKVILPQSSQVTHSQVPRAPSPVSPVRVAAMQQMYAPVARRARLSNPPTPAQHPVVPQPVPVAQPAQPVVQPVVQQARPIVAQWAPPPVPRVLPAKLLPRQQVSPLRQSPSPIRLNYQVPGTASPVQIAVPKPSPLDSPRSTATAATICPVPLSTPAYSERTIASPVVLSSLGRQSPHEKAALRAADRLAETARASLTNGLLWRPAPRPTPDPLLTALGPGGSGEDCCAMVRTPDPPESRKLSAVLESQPSLASSICPGRDSPGPQYTSAILLHTSSSKQNWRQISPGASCVVRPPSPQDVQGPKMMPGSFEELVANGAKAGALKVTLALFDLFCAAVSEKSIVEQVCVELSRQLNREELQWDQLVLLRPLQTLAQIVASLMSGSGPLKEETFWSMLGDEEEYLPWWKALLARHGLQRSGQILLQEQLADLIVSACRMLRDSFAPESYLRNLRTVRFGAHRLQDRYEDFQLLTPSRFGRTYRCRGRASDCLRHVSQV